MCNVIAWGRVRRKSASRAKKKRRVGQTKRRALSSVVLVSVRADTPARAEPRCEHHQCGLAEAVTQKETWACRKQAAAVVSSDWTSARRPPAHV